jgi:alpha-ketoglutarate-dependent taurine dioxygenase
MYVLFPAFLCYYAVAADAALQGRGHAARSAAAALPDIGRLIPHLELPASVTEAASDAVARLREMVLTSGLMRDTRPSAEQEKRDFVTLWADLEQSRPAEPAFLSD